MKLTITLADAYRREQFIAGRELARRHALEVPLADLTSESRAHLARVAPDLGDRTLDLRAAGQYRVASNADAFAAPLLPATGAEWDALLAAHRAAFDARQADLRTERIAYLARQAEAFRAFTGTNPPSFAADPGDEDLPGYAEMQTALAEAARAALARAEQKAAEDAAAEDAARAEKAAARAEKAAWIAAHGSDFLRRAHDAGYDCQRRYYEERAAAEYPGYYADFAGEVAYDRRACPSEAALAEAERTGGRVVWLRRPLPAIAAEDDGGYGDDGADEDPRLEAVVVEFLGHDLIKVI